MAAAKIRTGDELATYMPTLYGKALDAASPRSILHDRFAADAVARLDYDFAALKLPKGGEVTLPTRALHLDGWTRAFLADNPVATVLHLGCGLDTRVDRIDPGPQVRWFDVDLPAVIALREQLYPPRDGHRTIASSVTDLAWLDDIPGDTPVLVVCEGLLMYLRESEVAALLQRITRQFPRGQVVFDGYSGPLVRMISRFARIRGARIELRWGVDDPRDLEALVPGLELVECVEFLAMPALVDRLSTSKFSAFMHRALGRLPGYRRLIRHLRYQFTRA